MLSNFACFAFNLNLRPCSVVDVTVGAVERDLAIFVTDCSRAEALSKELARSCLVWLFHHIRDPIYGHSHQITPCDF